MLVSNTNMGLAHDNQKQETENYTNLTMMWEKSNE